MEPECLAVRPDTDGSAAPSWCSSASVPADVAPSQRRRPLPPRPARSMPPSRRASILRHRPQLRPRPATPQARTRRRTPERAMPPAPPRPWTSRPRFGARRPSAPAWTSAAPQARSARTAAPPTRRRPSAFGDRADPTLGRSAQRGGRGRSPRSFQTEVAPSRKIRMDILDWPRKRSGNTIGCSTNENPATMARYFISI